MMATLTASSDVTVVVNANRAGGTWTTLSMLLESLGLSGVPPANVLVVCRAGGAPADLPQGVKAVEADDHGDVTGLRHVAENPRDVTTRWVAYLQDTMVAGQDFAARAAEACAKAALATPVPMLCVTLHEGIGVYDAEWLASLGSPGSVADVLGACPADRRRGLDPEVRDTGTFRYPGDTTPPRRIVWFPAIDVYQFVPAPEA